MKAKVLAQQMVARNFGCHGVQTPLCASGHAGLSLPTACLVQHGQSESSLALGGMELAEATLMRYSGTMCPTLMPGKRQGTPAGRTP